ncbi:hypothetical protein CRENBAI_014822 [Crenichthys baileyi]|uniref:Uncharacterized protein n=1 Tax=Crenichthys baileyi TaxID=28760 RepID=A0AAV9QQU0_9TELE
MALEPVETRRMTGVASCSRLPSSQEIHETTTDRDYYLNLCSAGSLQRLGAQCDPRNPVHPPAAHSTNDYSSSSKSYQPTRAPGSTCSLWYLTPDK